MLRILIGVVYRFTHFSGTRLPISAADRISCGTIAFMKSWLRRILYLLVSLLGLYGLILLFLAWYPNFHTVIPEQVYRSAQLSGPEFNHYIQKYHIKSVINLRGADPSSPWYRDELAASQQNHVQHYDLHMEAMNHNSADTLRQLQQLIETSPKPILIHCWHGADRTGLASAMSILLLTDKPYQNARDQISFWYLAVDPRSTGKVTLDDYQTWLTQQHALASRESFTQWLVQLQ